MITKDEFYSLTVRREAIMDLFCEDVNVLVDMMGEDNFNDGIAYLSDVEWWTIIYFSA